MRTHTSHSINQNGSDKANQNEYQMWCDTIFDVAKLKQSKVNLIHDIFQHSQCESHRGWLNHQSEASFPFTNENNNIDYGRWDEAMLKTESMFRERASGRGAERKKCVCVRETTTQNIKQQTLHACTAQTHKL